MHGGCGGLNFPIKNEELGIGCLWLHGGEHGEESFILSTLLFTG